MSGDGRRREAEEWWPLLRDVATFSLGGLILVSQLFSATPSATLVAAGLALCGIAPAVRVQRRARRNGGGSAETTPEEE